MDSEIMYSIFGVLGLSFVAYKTLNAGKTPPLGKTKEERIATAIENYRISLQESLKGLDKDSEDRKAKKIMILREYSEELHFNVLFDENDVEKIIAALAGE